MTRQEFYNEQRKKAERQQRLIGLYETYRREYGDVDQWTKATSDKFDAEADAIRQEAITTPLQGKRTPAR